jgi:DnaJ domain
MKKNYYLILGVTADASSEEIRAAFRRQAQEVHPYQLGLESGRFQEVQEAPGESGDLLFQRRQIQQDMVDASRLLRTAIAA